MPEVNSTELLRSLERMFEDQMLCLPVGESTFFITYTGDFYAITQYDRETAQVIKRRTRRSAKRTCEWVIKEANDA
jgi:hypothetical protein